MAGRLTADEPISEWLHALASTGPNPGGGAAAALMAGMAAALAEMVVAHRAPDGTPDGEVRRRTLETFSAAIREAAALNDLPVDRITEVPKELTP